MRLFLDMSLADTGTNSLIVTGLAWGQNNIGGKFEAVSDDAYSNDDC